MHLRANRYATRWWRCGPPAASCSTDEEGFAAWVERKARRVLAFEAAGSRRAALP